VFVRSSDADDVTACIGAMLRRRGYRFHDAPIPARYPRQPFEVVERVTVSADGWVVVAPEERDRIFHWGRDVSEACSAATVAITVDPWGEWRAKIYASGKPVAKLGEDPDDEFLYPVAPATARELENAERTLALDKAQAAAFRRFWQAALEGETSPVRSFVRALGLPAVDGSFPELTRDPPNEYACWLRHDSPLRSL
jgi:hypothetical protein